MNSQSTLKELRDRFVERDNQSIEQLENWMLGPITESRRLAFLEGRVMDLAALVLYLLDYIDTKENQT